MNGSINPFDEIAGFVNQMSRQFEDASRNLEATEPFDRLPIWPEAIPVDVIDTDEELVVVADVPGFERDDVEVRVTDRRLRIDVDHEETGEEETAGQYLRHERRHKPTSRTLEVPAEIATDDVEAHLENGVLRITLPKEVVEKGREVQIAVE
jgi:HSP20 family protein